MIKLLDTHSRRLCSSVRRTLCRFLKSTRFQRGEKGDRESVLLQLFARSSNQERRTCIYLYIHIYIYTYAGRAPRPGLHTHTPEPSSGSSTERGVCANVCPSLSRGRRVFGHVTTVRVFEESELRLARAEDISRGLRPSLLPLPPLSLPRSNVRLRRITRELPL